MPSMARNMSLIKSNRFISWEVSLRCDVPDGSVMNIKVMNPLTPKGVLLHVNVPKDFQEQCIIPFPHISKP